MSGPAKKKAAKKRAPKRAHLRAVEPDDDAPAATGPVDPPAGLDGDALEVWNEVAPLLHAAGRLNVPNRHLLETYADAVATRRRAARTANRSLLKVGQRGDHVKDPRVAMARDWSDTVVKLGVALGLGDLDSDAGKGKTPARLLS